MKKQFFMGLLIGLFVASSISVLAATKILSSSIGYDNSKSHLSSENAQDAIDELYEKLYGNNPNCEELVGKSWYYDYTGGEQNFISACIGTYKIEAWGAQGGSATKNYAIAVEGGYGAYTSGEINLLKSSLLYINVGGQGSFDCNTDSECPGGYNGGGIGRGSNSLNVATGGGGATSIALKSGLLSTITSADDVVMVAAGGGGSGYGDENGTFY